MKRCLILMPFSNPDGTGKQSWHHFFQSLSGKIKSILPDYQCEVFYIGAGQILSNLMRAIVSSDLIICDLTYLKPNVLFELGMCMILEKPVMLLIQSDTRLPSDFSNYAYVRYAVNEKSGKLIFESNREQDVFEASLRYMIREYKPQSLLNTDSNLARILKAISNTLNQAIKLETDEAILAPALRSLFDSTVLENAQELGTFAEGNRDSVTIQIDGPRILFDVLIALFNDLSQEDQYDSITWRKHWVGSNANDSSRFIKAIVKRANDSPKMRRIFLVGVTDTNKDGGFVLNSRDVSAISHYYKGIRPQHRLKSNVLFLPDCLIASVAERCNMGKMIKKDKDSNRKAILYIFSRYSKFGLLESFYLTRGGDLKWGFKDFWSVSEPMDRFNWESKPVTVPKEFVHFSDTFNTIYDKPLLSLLNKIGVQTDRAAFGS